MKKKKWITVITTFKNYNLFVKKGEGKKVRQKHRH